MATTDTKVSQLIINKLTQAQYDGITTPSSTELYFVDDGKTYVTTDMLAQVATTGSYIDLSNKPTNVSAFANDAGYLTSIPMASANDLGGIKVGTGLSIDANGVLSATGSSAVDWSDITNKPSFATVATSGSYNDLFNKPTIPTVNDATLTIQKNGTSVGTFTANASSNATIDISVPTKTSDLNNDSGFITSIPTASSSTLGGIKVGSGLSIDNDGVLSASSGPNTLTITVTEDQQNPGTYVWSGATLAQLEAAVDAGKTIFVNDVGANYNPLAVTNAGFYGSEQEPEAQLFINNGADVTVYYLFHDNAADISEFSCITLSNKASTSSYGVTKLSTSTSSTSTSLAATPSAVKAAYDLANSKQDALTAGTNITISGTTISATDTTYTAGTGLDLTGTQFSIDNTVALKSEIPTVNNATLTIQKNGTDVETFTANSSTNKTANITVPTATSDLNNDSGFITKSVNDLTNYTLTSSLATVATSGSYNDLSNKPTIPAAQVNSDWNASSGVAQILNKPSLATVATTGAYSDLSGTPTIPTVNNATLTVTQNGTSAGTFTANASSNVTIALTDTTYSAFTGTDGTSAGVAGLVPAPATTDAGKFLKADGTWATIQSSGITYYTLSSHNIGAFNLEDTTMTMDTSTTLVDIRAAIANNVLVVLPIISGDPQSWTENCILSSYESVSQTLEYRFSLQYHGYAYRMVVEIKKGTNNVSFVKVAPTPTFTTNEWNALWA